MTEITLASVIAGSSRTGSDIAFDVNPARPEERIAAVSLAGSEIATDAVEAAASAVPGWQRLPAPARGDILRRAADILDSRADIIGRDLTREEGKTLDEAIGETRRAVAILRYYAGQALDPDGETFPSHSDKTFLYARRGDCPISGVSPVA